MIGGRGERVVEIRNEDLVEINMPTYAQSFKDREALAKERARQESLGVVDAYAAVIELGDSEDGIIFDAEQARKNLLELLTAKKDIIRRWRFDQLWGRDEIFVRMGESGYGTRIHEKSSDPKEQKRRSEIIKNLETIRSVFGAYRNLSRIFENFDIYIESLSGEYAAELKVKTEIKARESRSLAEAERQQKVEVVLARMKVETLAAKRAATGSGRSQLTVEEIQELGIRAEKAVPKLPFIEKPEMSEKDRESLERVRATSSSKHTMEELLRKIEESGLEK